MKRRWLVAEADLRRRKPLKQRHATPPCKTLQSDFIDGMTFLIPCRHNCGAGKCTTRLLNSESLPQAPFERARKLARATHSINGFLLGRTARRAHLLDEIKANEITKRTGTRRAPRAHPGQIHAMIFNDVLEYRRTTHTRNLEHITHQEHRATSERHVAWVPTSAKRLP